MGIEVEGAIHAANPPCGGSGGCAITASAGAESPFLLYAGDDEKVHVRVLIHAETLWLPKRLMAELFQTTPDNIGLHLKNIYAEGELVESATAEDFSVVRPGCPAHAQALGRVCGIQPDAKNRVRL